MVFDRGLGDDINITRRQLPHQGEDKSRQEGPDKDERAPSAPACSRVVRDIAQHRVRDSVKDAGDSTDNAHPQHIHTKAQVEDDDHRRQGGRLQVINKHADRIG